MIIHIFIGHVMQGFIACFQILDPQKIKIIQLQVEEEIEGSYKDKFKQHQKDYEALRSEHNKLKTEHIFLKSEYENDRKQYLSMLEENKMKYEAEVNFFVIWLLAVKLSFKTNYHELIKVVLLLQPSK